MLTPAESAGQRRTALLLFGLEAVHARLLDERRDPAEIFSLRTGDETRQVPLAEILFFETAPKAHHVFLHTACPGPGKRR